MVSLRILNEWRSGYDFNDQIVEQGDRRRQRPNNVHEKDYSDRIRVIPNFMRKSVIEEHAFALFPMSDRVTNPNPAGFLFFGNNQSEVISNNAFVGASVFRNVLAAGEDGKEGRLCARNSIQQSRRLRTPAKIVFGPQSISEKEERLPFVVVRDVLLIGRDILKVRKIFAVLHDLIELFPDIPPVLFDLARPWKVFGAKEFMVANQRIATHELLDLADDPAPIRND